MLSSVNTYSEAYWMALWRVLGEILGDQSRSKALVNSTSMRFSSSFPSFTSARVLRSTASIASTCSGCLTRCRSASWIMQSKIASFTLLFLTVVIYPILIGAWRRFAARFLNVIYGEALAGLRQRISGQRCDGVGRGLGHWRADAGDLSGSVPPGCIGVQFRFALSGCWVGLGFVFEIDGIAAVSCEVSGPVDIDDFEIQSDSPMTSLIDPLLAGKREAYAGDQC